MYLFAPVSGIAVVVPSKALDSPVAVLIQRRNELNHVNALIEGVSGWEISPPGRTCFQSVATMNDLVIQWSTDRISSVTEASSVTTMRCLEPPDETRMIICPERDFS